MGDLVGQHEAPAEGQEVGDDGDGFEEGAVVEEFIEAHGKDEGGFWMEDEHCGAIEGVAGHESGRCGSLRRVARRAVPAALDFSQRSRQEDFFGVGRVGAGEEWGEVIGRAAGDIEEVDGLALLAEGVGVLLEDVDDGGEAIAGLLPAGIAEETAVDPFADEESALRHVAVDVGERGAGGGAVGEAKLNAAA